MALPRPTTACPRADIARIHRNSVVELPFLIEGIAELHDPVQMLGRIHAEGAGISEGSAVYRRPASALLLLFASTGRQPTSPERVMALHSPGSDEASAANDLRQLLTSPSRPGDRG